jgi:hypothetical protein
MRVGQKLLYLIESSSDHSNSELIGKLFKLFLLGKISYEEFLGCSEICSRLSYQDILALKAVNYTNDISPRLVGSLFGSGLFEIYFDEGTLFDELDRAMGRAVNSRGSYYRSSRPLIPQGIHYALSKRGSIIKSVIDE